MKGKAPRITLEAARDLFGEENVRFLRRWHSRRVSRRRQGDGLRREQAPDLGGRVMAKTIKFDLPDRRGGRSLPSTISGTTSPPKLSSISVPGGWQRWLRSRSMARELAAVEGLASDDDDAVTLKELCRIFEVEAGDVVIAAAIAKAKERSKAGLETRLHVPGLSGMSAASGGSVGLFHDGFTRGGGRLL